MAPHHHDITHSAVLPVECGHIPDALAVTNLRLASALGMTKSPAVTRVLRDIKGRVRTGLRSLSRLALSAGRGALEGVERRRMRSGNTAVSRGPVVEAVTVGVTLDPFLSLRALAAYSGLSVRKLRDYLDAAMHPLPHYRVGGKILVRQSEFDAWMSRYRQVGDVDVEQIVEDVLGRLP
jgi:hypothetical protein